MPRSCLVRESYDRKGSFLLVDFLFKKLSPSRSASMYTYFGELNSPVN